MALKFAFHLPFDLIRLAFDWCRLALTRLQRIMARENKRTCPFCRDTGQAYTNTPGRSCYAALKYGNDWLAKGLCDGLKPCELGDAPLVCECDDPGRGPVGSFFRTGLILLLAFLATAAVLQVQMNFFPRAARKVQRVVFGPPTPTGLAADPAMRELQIRLVKLSSQAAHSDPELAAVYEAEGDEHFQDAQLRMARLEYAVATRLNPTNGPLWHKLGRTYLRLGSAPLALQAFKSEIDAAGDSAVAREALALTCALTRRTEEALEHAIASHELAEDGNVFALLELLDVYAQRRNVTAADETGQAAFDRAPDDPRVLYAIAQANVTFHNPQTAETWFRKALERKPDHQPSLLGLANVLVQQGGIDEANILVERARAATPEALPPRALEIEIVRRREGNEVAIRRLRDLQMEYPEYAWAQVRLAELLLLGGDFDRAYGAAVELSKSSHPRTRWDGLWLQTRMFFAQGLLKKAIEICEPLTDQGPYMLEARMLQAQARMLRKEYRAAVTQLNQTIRRYPDHKEAYLRLCEALVRLGDPVQAEAVLDRIVEQLEGSFSSYKLKGDYYMLSGEHPERAREAFEKAMELAPDNLGLRYDYILLLAEKLEDLPLAASQAEAILAEHPDDPVCKEVVGWMRCLEGRLDESATLLENAVSAAPQVAVFRGHLGKLYHRQGRVEEAKRELRIALSLKPGFYGAGEARDLLRDLEGETVRKKGSTTTGGGG